MGEAEVLEVSTEAIVILLKISLPVMAIALGVGLIISLFQALTQIQEMTLSFVPKIIAIFVSLILLLPYIFTTLFDFTQTLYGRIIGV